MVDISHPAPLAYLDWCKEHHPEATCVEDTERRDWVADFVRHYWQPAGGRFTGVDYAVCLGRQIHAARH
jgi:hypothetical protein